MARIRSEKGDELNCKECGQEYIERHKAGKNYKQQSWKESHGPESGNYQIVVRDSDTHQIIGRETGFDTKEQAQEIVDTENEFGFHPNTASQYWTVEPGGGFKREIIHSDGTIEPHRQRRLADDPRKWWWSGIEPGPNDFGYGPSAKKDSDFEELHQCPNCLTVYHEKQGHQCYQEDDR